MISCRRCLHMRITLQQFRVYPKLGWYAPIAAAKSKFIGENAAHFRSISLISSNCQAAFVKSPDHNVTKAVSDGTELHEEEFEEEIHAPYLTHFHGEHSEHTDITIDGVPQELGDSVPSKAVTSDSPVQKHNEAEKKKSTKKKTKGSTAKTKAELASEELKREALEMDKKKEIAVRHSMSNYLKMCMQQNMVFRTMMILKSYHAEEKFFKSSEVYDAVLKEAATRCSWKLIKEIVGMMDQQDVPFSPDSFASCFICVGRRSETENGLQYLSENLLDKMESCGIFIEDVFQSSKFVDSQRDWALKGVRLALPDYEPPPPSSKMTYNTPLLDSLNDLQVNSDIKSPADGLLNQERLSELSAEQFESEMSGIMNIRSISNTGTMDLEAIREMEEMERNWAETLREAVIRDFAVCKAQFESTRRKSVHIYPFLATLETDDYVRILSQEVQMLSRTSDLFSPSMYIFCRSLGIKVMNEARILRKKENGQLLKFRGLYEKYCQWYLEPMKNGELYNPRQMWQHLVDEAYSWGSDLDAEEIWWPSSVVHAVGQFLYNILLNNLKIKDSNSKNKQLAPAFYVVFRTKGLKTIKEIKPHHQLIKLHDEMRKKKLSFDATLLPMLSPPLPWHSHKHGGYLINSVPLVRLPPYASQQKLRLEKNPLQQLYPALDALNALGTIPWRINSGVLDLAIQVFNANGSKELDVPQPPSELPAPPPIDPDLTAIQKAKAHKERAAYKRRKAEMYSLWCDTLYRLSLANHFRKRMFWLPHNMDFRGRVYPCSPHLTHLSHDMARSLLCFAQGKKLGPDGFNWLKLHVINLTGKKKREPVSERLSYADEVMPEILDSAEHPLTGRKWWIASDEPWQTLAACMAVAEALRCPDGPASYVCHLPIHQDGSCNGLQHYAALGRDQVGAESVNLAPADRPQDVYSNVALLVERERIKDAANGIEIAKVLEGHVSRKVIKQTVMTTVYGVTRYGARLQIAKQLKEIAELTSEQVVLGSSYLAEKTFQSLQEMFTSAKEIQDWFTESAKLISTVVGENVEWVTPIGLPVVQPYSRNPSDPASRPNVMKQRNAFPPNFIHSLDSSHMMLTALHCQRKGITFASIHDCFWTHPCTVNEMNQICRQQFVSLHSQPILEDLSKFMVSQFAGQMSEEIEDNTPKGLAKHRLNQILREVPRRGTFDLRLVLDSVYFFS